MSYVIHDPDDTVIYLVDWTGWLAEGDTVSGAAWSVSPSGPTVTPVGVVANVATAKLTGVVWGRLYELTCQATLSTGALVSQSITIRGTHR